MTDCTFLLDKKDIKADRLGNANSSLHYYKNTTIGFRLWKTFHTSGRLSFLCLYISIAHFAAELGSMGIVLPVNEPIWFIFAIIIYYYYQTLYKSKVVNNKYPKVSETLDGTYN